MEITFFFNTENIKKETFNRMKRFIKLFRF